MKILTTGLITDGTSDQALIPLLTSLLESLLPNTGFQPPQWIAPQGRKTLADRLAHALDPDQFHFDILFVHRDAENETFDKRALEISQATPQGPHPVVCVVPIKMTEAWLLTSEAAIKQAVGNPQSKAKLKLPPVTKIEACDAKSILDTALTEAKELNTLRRRKFKPEQFRARVAEELAIDLMPLRKVPSFRRLEQDLRDLLDQKKIPHAAL